MEWFGMIGGAAVAVCTVVTLMYLIVDRRAKQQDTHVESVIEQRIAPISERISLVEAQLRSNGGTSLRDKVVRTEVKVDGVVDSQTRMAEDVTALRLEVGTLSALAARAIQTDRPA